MSRYTKAVLGELDRIFRRGTVAGLTEGKLLERFVVGRDDAAFAALVARHGPMVLGVCRRILRDEHDIEDAFQATFLVLVRRASAIRDGDLLGQWLYGVAHRVAVRARANAARRHVREPAADRAVKAAIAPPSADDAHRELRAVLDEELARLPDSLRAPLVLCYLEGLTHEEAARRLRWPVGTVRSRMARARDRLRPRLARRGLAGDDAALTAVLAGTRASVPPALLDVTVKASLGFASHEAATATSATAVALAERVIHAMMLAKLKILGAATLACVVALAGVQTYALQLGGIGGEPPTSGETVPRSGNPQVDLLRKVNKFQVELDEMTRRNAELQTQVKALRAELEALRPARPPADTKAIPNAPRVAKGVTYVRLNDQNQGILVISPEGDRAAVYYPKPQAVKSLQLSEDKTTPREVMPISSGGLVALFMKGEKITRTAVFNLRDGTWYPLDFREPVDIASPLVTPGAVAYVLGRRVYAFTSESARWDVLELSEGTKPKPTIGPGSITCEHDDHIYTFDNKTGKWNDLDIRAILDIPEDKDDAKSKLGPPR